MKFVVSAQPQEEAGHGPGRDYVHTILYKYVHWLVIRSCTLINLIIVAWLKMGKC